MANPGDILAARAKLHRHNAFCNQLAGHRPDDVHAKYFVGRSVCEHLDHAGGIAQRPGAAIGQEGKAAGPVSAPLGLELLLGLADPGDFRVGVDDPGNGVEVHMPMLSGYAFGHRDALLLGLVREHRSSDDIADRPHPGQVGSAVAVNNDRTALVKRQTDRLRVEPLGVGDAADRHNQLVHLQRAGFALGAGIADANAGFSGCDLAYADPEFNSQPLFDEGLMRLLRDLFVDRAQKAWQALQNRHV